MINNMSDEDQPDKAQAMAEMKRKLYEARKQKLALMLEG
jgi:hypothetical protein